MHTRKKLILAGLLFFGMALTAALIVLMSKEDSANKEQTQQPAAAEEQQAAEAPKYSPMDLQPTIDAWQQKYNADYSIQIYDLQSKSVIAESTPDEAIFAASIYKIYVAYFALLDFQTGDQNPDEIILAGQTKRECVDKMIRESDSPCGESMMADMGQANLTQRAKDAGFVNTVFNGIQTSAADSVKVLALIHEAKQLNKENTDYLLDAMLTQDVKYKRGLEKGAPDATWQTKVGWNLDINYHDIGIMTLPDGRAFAVAIFGQGSGSPAPIADFADTIYTALTAQ